MFTESLTGFFSTADFAVEAPYKAGGIGSGVAKNVIFDRAFLDQLGVSSTNPVALGIATDFSGFTTTDTLTIAGTVYRIVDRHPHDDGATVLLQLEDQTA